MPTTGKKAASLYFHIPFCAKKCPYCHFYVIPNEKRFATLLTEGLFLEWEMQKHLLQNFEIVSIYFGGGTPTLYGAEAIGNLLSHIPISEDCEITVEGNPEDGTLKLFQELKQVGVNRISLGVQSLDDRSLAKLERTHSAKKAKEAIFAVKEANISNLSIDLMYDLPDQTESSWRFSLDVLQNLPIDHLSLYNLTIEPHTSFYRRKDTLRLPTPKASLNMLELGLERLDALGLKRYEISAFARPGFESRHNLGYWTFRPFLGLGPSAFSYWNNTRFQNISNIQRYVRMLRQKTSPVHFSETLAPLDHVKERLAVELRLIAGTSLPQNLSPQILFSLAKLEQEGLLTISGSNIRLTSRGMLFYDSVASDII